MNKFFSTLLFLLLAASWSESVAQFADDFSDGNFTANPVWTGDITKFEIDGNFQLHSNGPALSDTAYLSTANSVVFSDTIQWEFYFNMNFDPSNNNNMKVYLVSNQENLKGQLQGYYLRVGENGSADKLNFYKQSGTTGTQIFSGTVGTFGINPAEGRVKVVRDPDGNWTFYSDSTGGTNYTLEGSVMDTTYHATSYFGVSCKYTTSNNVNFFFDDFNVTGSTFVDNTAPTVTSVSITSQNSVDVVFSETVSQSTAENLVNYSADNGLGNPQSAMRDVSNSNIVHLTFASQFTLGTLYTLGISSVQDLAGNMMVASQHPFIFYNPQRYDVVFNEIMADPTPALGLPEYEFTELYNRTQVPINVKNWKFTYGTSTKILPAAVIYPDSFLVLVSPSAFPEFAFYGNAIEVTGLSTTALTNGGQSLLLQDSSGNVIHSLRYDISWYANTDKDDGGWSIEQIDPDNICGDINNWVASVHPLGGTPGRRNSVNAPNPDTEPPSLERVSVTDNVTIIAYFNEKLDSLDAVDITNFVIDNSIGTPLAAVPVWPGLTTVTLTLAQPLQLDVIYTLTVFSNLKDCTGNSQPSETTQRFAIPQDPDSNDIVINEILFYPRDGGYDFVELYNRSEKVIDLSKLMLGNYDTTFSIFSNQKVISTTGYLFFPEEYIVLTANPDAVKSQYNTTNPTNFIKLSSMPSFNIDAGGAAISDTLNNVKDYLIYDEDMHIPLLNSLKGVSLERISFNRPSNDRTNWHSAAEDVGFATPAYRNSQFDVPVVEGSPFTVEPEIFSPDNDGYNDVVNFNYTFDSPGYICSITLFDSRGRTIKKLLVNELLGTSGTVSWDGINDSYEKGRIGIYVAFIELFNTSGDQKKYKHSFVLGGKL